MDIDKIKEVISEQLGVEKSAIKNDSHFVNDLGADSLDTVELVMALEDMFGIEVDDDDAEKMLTLQHIIDFLTAQGK